jgi:hypothetical protein
MKSVSLLSTPLLPKIKSTGSKSNQKTNLGDKLMKKQKMLFASLLLCLMLSISVLADGDAHTVGRSCPADTQCSQSVDPITNLIWYIWQIIS